ncbi:MAG: hypothetical protein ACK5QR_04795, partial [bacterium]
MTGVCGPDLAPAGLLDRLLPQTDTPVEEDGKSTTFRMHTRHGLSATLRPSRNTVALPHYAGRGTT